MISQARGVTLAWGRGVMGSRRRSGGYSTVPHCSAAWGRMAALVRLAFDCLVESWQALRRWGWQGVFLPGPRPLDGLMALLGESHRDRGVSGPKHGLIPAVFLRYNDSPPDLTRPLCFVPAPESFQTDPW